MYCIKDSSGQQSTKYILSAFNSEMLLNVEREPKLSSFPLKMALQVNEGSHVINMTIISCQNYQNIYSSMKKMINFTRD